MNKFLTDLIEEVETTPLDIDIFGLEEASDDDEVIGQITDDFTRRLMVARNKVMDKGKELALSAINSNSLPTRDTVILFQKTERKHDLLDRFFWVAVHEEVPASHKHNRITIKKDWQVVAVKEEPPRCTLGGTIGVIIAQH
ncbi:MAG TPA: hypothetical protein ENN31_01345 [Candidatus Vogelbacteria bacterium]|nr:hypothetical protein [Candidatus Vogelbacteria bacterium]